MPKPHAGYDLVKKIRIVLAGLWAAINLDFSVRYKVVVSLVFIGIATYLRSPFVFLFILTVTGLMLITEILNTVVETLCDYIQPGPDPKIALIKDMAASAAGIALLIWWAVMLFVVSEVSWRIFWEK
jgi:diacylglycerol kinase